MPGRSYNSNYGGRLVDLEVLTGIEKPDLEHELALTPVRNHAGRAVTGMQKLAQRYVITLLSSVDKTYGEPGYGTLFWESVVRGILRSASAASSLFNYSNVLAVNQLIAEDALYPDTPEDERIESARLLDIHVDKNAASTAFVVDLVSRAGEHYVYKVPVSMVGVI